MGFGCCKYGFVHGVGQEARESGFVAADVEFECAGEERGVGVASEPCTRRNRLRLVRGSEDVVLVVVSWQNGDMMMGESCALVLNCEIEQYNEDDAEEEKV
ncbi:hypothetical protein JHK87_026261 [Glycine soja]|nr:hypothetical protein JHK87_026261 [Glycine soja]